MKKVIIIILLLTVNNVMSQDFRFGKVSKEELSEIANPQDVDASASILYRKQKVFFEYEKDKGFVQKNKIYERIKIYNKDGLNQATKKVVLYNKSNSTEEDIRGLKAVTYNLVNGKVTEDKLKKDGIFEEENNEYWKTKKFTMPNVKEGSVIEYMYTIESPFRSIDDIELQQSIPIKKIDVEVLTPEYYNYKKLTNLRARFFPEIKISSKNNRISFNSGGQTFSSKGMPTGTRYNNSTVDYIENIISINEVNIPALKDEIYVDNLKNYQSKLILELEYVKYPSEPIESFSTTWEKVVKTIYDHPEFGAQLDKTGYYEDDIEDIVNNTSNQLKKIALIFDHVKTKVKWNDLRGYLADQGVKKAYKEGSGNVADINLMLVSMLRYAGINANPVLVSTKDNGIPILPTRTGFNYIICAIEIEGETILLDATHKFLTFNVLPNHVLNWKGRLIKENGASNWINLYPKEVSKEIVLLNVKINEDLSIDGKIRNQYTNHQALRQRSNNDNKTGDEVVENLENGKGEIEISHLEIENLTDLSEPFKYSYDYVCNDALEEVANKLYFSPLLFLAPKENPFKQDTRQYPIDFVYPIADKYMINIMFPEGYVVESLPENIKIQFNGTEGEFAFLARVSGNMLQVTMSLKLNKTLIIPQEYEEFKKFYKIMIEKQTEKVILVKT